jgi:hypothetical protein
MSGRITNELKVCKEWPRGPSHMSSPSIYSPLHISNRYVQLAQLLRTRGWSAPLGWMVRRTCNDYISCLKYVRAVRKSEVQTVRQPWPDCPKPGNMEHQSSDHDELTHSDCPPYKAGRSVTWELVLSGLRPRTVRSTSAQKHTVPAQTYLAPADGPPTRPDSPHNYSGTV